MENVKVGIAFILRAFRTFDCNPRGRSLETLAFSDEPLRRRTYRHPQALNFSLRRASMSFVKMKMPLKMS